MTRSGLDDRRHYRVYQGSKLLAVGQAAAPLRADGTVSFIAASRRSRARRYTIDMDANDISGNHALRRSRCRPRRSGQDAVTKPKKKK